MAKFDSLCAYPLNTTAPTFATQEEANAAADALTVQVYVVPREIREEPPMPFPSLWHYVTAALEQESDDASSVGELTAIGRLAQLVYDENSYRAVFTDHPSAVEATGDEEVRHLSTLAVDGAVVDAIVNGAVLLGADNFCYGRTANGLLVQFIAFVEPGEA